MSSVEIISDSFPPEIIREILLKAAAKSLLRCKLVCKEWYPLISDPNFIKSHHSTNKNIHSYSLVYYSNEEIKICPLYDVLFHKSVVNNALLLENPFQIPPWLRIAGSCNGLLCFFVEDRIYYDLYVYNPCTRIWKHLHAHVRNADELQHFSFGYDESTDDYKIVQLSQASAGCIMTGRIYSLKTAKSEGFYEFAFKYLLNGCGVFSNGALHWVLAKHHHSPETHTHKIISLDLANHSCGEVLLFEYDKSVSLDDTNLILGVFGESLCGLCYYSQSHADLWVMKVYGVKDSWTKIASFPYPTNDWIDDYPVPLFVSTDGKALFRSSKGFVIYDSQDRSVSSIDFKFNEACIVVESLVSPPPPLAHPSPLHI